MSVTREASGGCGWIEDLGDQASFENCFRVPRPGGVISSLDDSGNLFTFLCPGGKERMRRLMEVFVRSRAELRPLVTHRFTLVTASVIRMETCAYLVHCSREVPPRQPGSPQCRTPDQAAAQGTGVAFT